MVKLFGLVILLAAVPAFGLIEITGLKVAPEPFSPNGDGRRDSTIISFDLSSDHESVYLWVTIEDEGHEPFVPLVSGDAVQPGKITQIWDGHVSEDEVVPDGRYFARVEARFGEDISGTHWHDVVADTTPPKFSADFTPDIYRPNAPQEDSVLTADVSVWDTQPDDWMVAWITIGAEAETLFSEQLTKGDTTYSFQWDGREDPEGTYEIVIWAYDAAENQSQTPYGIDIFLDGPAISFTYPDPAEAYISVLPEEVTGTAFDADGIDSIGFRFLEETSYQAVQLEPNGDTLQWYVEWPVDLRREGAFDLECIASDVMGYETIETFKVTIDTTLPDTPDLAEVPEKVSGPDLTVSGMTSPKDSVLLCLNCSSGQGLEPTERTVSSAVGTFVFNLSLGVGTNSIVVWAKDKAGNLSADTVEVTVEYNEDIGILVPEIFHGGSDVEVNLAKRARTIVMRVFSIDGTYIDTLDDFELAAEGAGAYYYRREFELVDSNEDEIKNGVYLLVFEILFEDGTSENDKKAVVVAR
jgi:hypothetical protein